MTLRSRLALSGLAGIAGGAALMGGALFVWQRSGLTPLITGQRGMLALLGFVLFFSLGEVPLMIYALRRLTASAAGVRPALATNAAFTFFSAVYAAPFLLLTGQVAVSLALAGLCLVRLAGALWLGTPAEDGG
jgi:hypothetical protein